MKPMEKTKQLNDLTLLDRFLFASVMEDEETLELALSIIMGEEVHLRQPNQVEKEFRTMPWLRSVRLDVYNVDDKDRLYDAEVQERNTGNLAKRSRFYQALIDSTLLPPGRGVSFNQLPASYLIMIMPFDLWGCGKYRYTFKTVSYTHLDVYKRQVVKYPGHRSHCKSRFSRHVFDRCHSDITNFPEILGGLSLMSSARNITASRQRDLRSRRDLHRRTQVVAGYLNR